MYTSALTFEVVDEHWYPVTKLSVLENPLVTGVFFIASVLIRFCDVISALSLFTSFEQETGKKHDCQTND